MPELIVNRAAPDLEPVGDGWTVYGMAVPYNREQRVSDDGHTYYLESFSPGAFTRDVAKGGRWVNLFLGHAGDEGDRWLGRCVALNETDAGLFPTFRINREHPQAEAARAGELVGWSVSAHVYRSRRESRMGMAVVHRDICGLSHVAATPSPQYAGAGVLVARDHIQTDDGTRTPRLDALRAAGFGPTRAR
jgi:HK97 family phage prohead protease